MPISIPINVGVADLVDPTLKNLQVSNFLPDYNGQVVVYDMHRLYIMPTPPRSLLVF